MMPSFQGARWCFTINNPTQADRDHVAGLGINPLRKYLVVGREQGQSGTPHLQGFVVFTRALTRTRVSSLLPRAHLQPTRGTSKQAADYCKKDGDFDEYGDCPLNKGANGLLDAFYEWGKDFIASNGRAPTSPEVAREHPTVYLRYNRCVKLFEAQAPIPELRNGEPRAWQSDLADELGGEADDRSILFYVDEDGGKGKSWFQAWYLTQHPDKVQVLSAGRRDDVAHSVDPTKSVFFFNIPRGGMEYLQYTILEQLKDRMVYSPKYNSKMKFLTTTPHVVVFCNEEPDLTKMSADRFAIRSDYRETANN